MEEISNLTVYGVLWFLFSGFWYKYYSAPFGISRGECNEYLIVFFGTITDSTIIEV
jgi:hypothetical protein